MTFDFSVNEMNCVDYYKLMQVIVFTGTLLDQAK